MDASDDFNRADGPLGANWVVSPDEFAGTTITSNEVVGGFQELAVWHLPCDTDDCFAEVTAVNSSPPSSIWGPILCLPTDAFPDDRHLQGYRINVDNWMDDVSLMRLGVSVASSTGLLYSSSSGPYTWRMEREGAVVRVLLDGVEVIEWTDPSPLTGRYCGMSGADPTTRLDNWSGGDIGGGGGITQPWTAVRVGASLATAVYVGETLVWSP